MQRRWRLVKRGFDLVLAVAILPIALLLIALCALAIWIDSPGQIIFRQRRTGLHGRRFAMYKFRTMVANAEALKVQYQHLNILRAPDFKIPNDPRITRVGGVLRKTSLDELPQLLNIIKGDMSFVGPRPTSFAPPDYDVWHGERLEAVPGLTGLWQISGRGETEFDDRLRLDIQYLHTWSLWLDLKVIVLTLGAVIRRKGAV